MNIYDRFHEAISNRIDPTFDKIKSICNKYPKLETPACLALLITFPSWCVLGAFVNSRRNR